MDPTLRHPYNIFPIIRRLKNEGATMSPDERRRLLTTLVLNVADREAVALALDLTGDDFAHLYPPEPKPEQVTTEGAIETFLDKFGRTSPDEDALLERLIFNPVPEYATQLADQNIASATDGPVTDSDPAALAAIASAINAPAPEIASETTVTQPKPAKPVQSSRPRSNDSGLTLELARIFIKQQRFDRAHEIISKISLNNPEKSVYFANQLRFLEKLIKIRKLQQDARNQKTHNL